jgi:hypothetical protein
MFSEVSGVHCLRNRRVLCLSSDASGFATAILSELEECYELSVWLHVYGMVKVGDCQIGSKKRGKVVDNKSAQLIWHPKARKLCVVVDGYCSILNLSWEDPITGTSTTMMKAIHSTDEGLDTDIPPTGKFVKAKLRSICEVPHHTNAVSCFGAANHLLIGMTGMVAKLSWDGYIIGYYALPNDTTVNRTFWPGPHIARGSISRSSPVLASLCKTSSDVEGLYSGNGSSSSKSGGSGSDNSSGSAEENAFKGRGCSMVSWSNSLGGVVCVMDGGAMRVLFPLASHTVTTPGSPVKVGKQRHFFFANEQESGSSSSSKMALSRGETGEMHTHIYATGDVQFSLAAPSTSGDEEKMARVLSSKAFDYRDQCLLASVASVHIADNCSSSSSSSSSNSGSSRRNDKGDNTNKKISSSKASSKSSPTELVLLLGSARTEDLEAGNESSAQIQLRLQALAQLRLELRYWGGSDKGGKNDTSTGEEGVEDDEKGVKNRSPAVALEVVTVEEDNPRLVLLTHTSLLVIDITALASGEWPGGSAAAGTGTVTGTGTGTGTSAFDSSISAVLLHAMDVATASPPSAGPSMKNYCVSMCHALGRLLLCLSSGWPTDRDATNNSSGMSANSTVHTCPLLTPAGGSLAHPEASSCSAGDMQSSRNGKYSGVFLFDAAQRTLLTFQGICSRPGIGSEEWLCSSSSLRRSGGDNQDPVSPPSASSEGSGYFQFDACAALARAEPVAGTTGKLCRVPFPSPLCEEYFQHIMRFANKNKIEGYTGKYSGNIASGLLVASSDSGGRRSGDCNGCSGSTGHYYSVSFGSWPAISSSSSSSSDESTGGGGSSLWLCNALTGMWQSVDLNVGNSQRDSRASVLSVPLEMCAGMTDNTNHNPTTQQPQTGPSSTTAQAGGQQARTIFGGITHMLGTAWLWNHSLLLLTQRSLSRIPIDGEERERAGDMYCLEMVSREFVRGRERTAGFYAGKGNSRRPVPAVHKLLCLPPYLNQALAGASSNRGSADFCFDVLAAPHLSSSTEHSSVTTSVVVVGSGDSFCAYQVEAETRNGSVRGYQCRSLWHIGSLRAALPTQLPGLLRGMGGVGAGVSAKIRGILTAAGGTGLVILGSDNRLVMVHVESTTETGRARARKSLGGMPEEHVDVDVEVAKLVPVPFATQFGPVLNFRVLPAYALLDTTVIGGGIGSSAGASALYISMQKQRRQLLWVPLPLGIADSIHPDTSRSSRSSSSSSSSSSSTGCDSHNNTDNSSNHGGGRKSSKEQTAQGHMYTQDGGLLVPLPVLSDAGSVFLGISSGMLLHTQQRIGLFSGYALASPVGVEVASGASSAAQDDDKSTIKGAASTALSAISSAGGGLHVRSQSLSCSILLNLAGLYRNNVAVWLARGLLRVLKGETFRGESDEEEQYSSHSGGGGSPIGEYHPSSALFQFVDSLEECLVYLLAKEGQPARYSKRHQLRLDAQARRHKKYQRGSDIDLIDNDTAATANGSCSDSGSSLLKQTLSYPVLVRFLYAVDALLLMELLASIGRRSEPSTSRNLVPVALRSPNSPHELRSPLSLFEECLYRGWHLRASRVLTLACDYVGGVENLHSTIECLALALELLRCCILSCKAGLAKDCLAFCTRIEVMLESTVRESSAALTASNGYTASSNNSTGGDAGEDELGNKQARGWGGAMRMVPGVGALLQWIHTLDQEIAPELSLGSKIGGSNVKTVKNRIGGTDGHTYSAFSEVKAAMGPARLAAILEHTQQRSAAVPYAVGGTIYAGASFSSTLLVLQLRHLLANGQYCAAAVVTHGILSLPQARHLLRGHLTATASAQPTPLLGVSCGSAAASLDLLRGCTFGSQLTHRLSQREGSSFVLSQCHTERRRHSNGEEEREEEEEGDLYGTIRGLSSDPPTTRGHLLPALAVAFLVTGHPRAAGAMCVLADLGLLAACFFHLEFGLFDANAGGGRSNSGNGSDDSDMQLLVDADPLRGALASLFLAHSDGDRPSIASLRLGEDELRASLEAMSSPRAASPFDEGEGEGEREPIPGSPQSSHNLGARYLRKVGASLQNARTVGEESEVTVAEAVACMDDREWITSLLSLRAVRLNESIPTE